MPRIPLLFVLCLLFLSACNIPTAPPATTPTADVVATQVIQLLTAAPTKTIPPVELTSAPTATQIPPLPTSTSTPTMQPASATNTSAPTLPPGDPKSSLGTPTWTYTFDSGKAFYQYENDHTRVTMENGALLLTGLTPDGWLGWSLTYSHPAWNFYLEGVLNPQACAGTDMYGLVFRAPDADSGYFYGVTCDGRYNLHARDFAANTDTILINLTSNSAILPGANQVNRLGVLANGEKISLYANGLLLQEITDNTFNSEGDFGALVAANETPGFTVKLTDISLWDLP
ncbi:MAG: hypothetical protein EHM21_04045 [Chloroflexi bacterium]|nr:MAG: hypothetical protein EHM21_04045 [Chloroflexota bacterium]